MRRYNEPITDVVVDQIGGPKEWTWRGRRYTVASRFIDHWVSTDDWWRLMGSADGPRSYEHWLVDACGPAGEGHMELSHIEGTGQWLLVGFID